MSSQRHILHAEHPRQQLEPRVSWLPTAPWKRGLFLSVACVAALASGVLFAFAGMTEQQAQLGDVDNEEGTRVQEAPEEKMAAIRNVFEDNSNQEQNAPSKYSASPSVNLLCQFSPRYRAGMYPYGVCTHFIYASVPNHSGTYSPDVLYSYDQGAFKKFLHMRDTAPDVRLLLSVELQAMLHTGWAPKRLASDARVWLDRSGVDGLHVTGLDVLPRTVQNITDIVTALRKSFKRQYLLTIGIDRTKKVVENELIKILKLVDIASFSTSNVRHSEDRTTLSNPYDKYENSTSGRFLSREITKVLLLSARLRNSHLCFTLTLGGKQFLLTDPSQNGLGAPGTHIRVASYAEICRKHWSEVKYIEPAMGYYAHIGRTWVSYDTEKTIAAKVQLAMRNHPELCVMLLQVDMDDIRGVCSERHFPLVQSVRHAMRLYRRKPPEQDS